MQKTMILWIFGEAGTLCFKILFLSKKPDSRFFSNYLEFQNWKIYNSVELPIYIINNAKKQHKIDDINIKVKDEETSIFVIREGFYNYETGATFVEDGVFL